MRLKWLSCTPFILPVVPLEKQTNAVVSFPLLLPSEYGGSVSLEEVPLISSGNYIWHQLEFFTTVTVIFESNLLQSLNSI